MHVEVWLRAHTSNVSAILELPTHGRDVAMLTLEFSTDDTNLIALATAYWSRAEGAGWDHKLTAVEGAFAIGRGKVLPAVAKICVARLNSQSCVDCGQGMPLRSRADVDFVLKKSRWRRRATESGPICSDCRDLRVLREIERRRAAAQVSEEAISAHLLALAGDMPMRDYESMTLREAFLLVGMLRYAGDAWKAPRLSAWSRGLPHLCDTETDMRSVFNELYASKWIGPDPDSSSDAFSMSIDGRLQVDVLRVDWVFASDSGGLPPAQLLHIAQRIEARATAADLYPIWEWVCLCELRAQFAYCQQVEKWPGTWTDALERNLVQLLKDCALGPAKTLLWKCVRYLIVDLHARKRPAPHTYNLLPGNLLRTLDLYQSKGWRAKSWRPMSTSLYSQHLFNHVMGAGEQLYDTETGNALLRRVQDTEGDEAGPA